MTVRGGLRSRCIADSVRVMVLAELIGLGWFDAGRRNKPLAYIPKPQDWDQPVNFNSFSITPENDRLDERSFGGENEGRTRLYVDFFAENESIATHFLYDVRSILLGLTAGRSGPVCDVYDLRVVYADDPPMNRTTPEQFTRVDLTNVRVDRPTGFPREWQRHWVVLTCWVEDDYLELSPTVVLDGTWTAEMWEAWVVHQAAESGSGP